jgi:aspartate/methionine/tyrosine aminotransferase
MIGRLNLTELIAKHQTLESAIQGGREGFLSDWNGGHPFVTRFLGAGFAESILESDLSEYIYFDDQQDVISAICRFHRLAEGLSLAPANVLAGPGSSSILVALSLWLLQTGVEEVFYIPPLYYTFHFFLKSLKIRLRPVTGHHCFEDACVLNLPPRKAALLMTDPIWYAGRRLTAGQVETVAKWQKKTGSFVLVDGSFQYMQWAATRHEYTSALLLDRTFRLISPTKSLAIPAFRFAYLIHPAEVHARLLFLYESIVGGANASDLSFARRALHLLCSQGCNRLLTEFLESTYSQLIENKIIGEAVRPDCGYFAFAIPNKAAQDRSSNAVMTQDYFELRGYPNCIRLNLMTAYRLYLANSARIA